MSNIGYEGTCPCCFRTQSVAGERLVLHGYTRPGDGYTHGSCMGVGELAFELSTEGTLKFIAALKNTIAYNEGRIATIKDGRLATFSRKKYTGVGRTGYETVLVVPGDARFEECKLVAIYDCESTIRMAQLDLADAEKRVSEWQLGTLTAYNIQQRLHEEKEAVAARKAAKKAAAEQKRINDKLKRVFEELARAIASHAEADTYTSFDNKVGCDWSMWNAHQTTGAPLIARFSEHYGKTAKQFKKEWAKARKAQKG